MTSDLLTRYKVTKDFIAGYNITNASRTASALRIRLSLTPLNDNPGFCLHKNLPIEQLLSAAPSGAAFGKSACPFVQQKVSCPEIGLH